MARPLLICPAIKTTKYLECGLSFIKGDVGFQMYMFTNQKAWRLSQETAYDNIFASCWECKTISASSNWTKSLQWTFVVHYNCIHLSADQGGGCNCKIWCQLDKDVWQVHLAFDFNQHIHCWISYMKYQAGEVVLYVCVHIKDSDLHYVTQWAVD